MPDSAQSVALEDAFDMDAGTILAESNGRIDGGKSGGSRNELVEILLAWSDGRNSIVSFNAHCALHRTTSSLLKFGCWAQTATSEFLALKVRQNFVGSKSEFRAKARTRHTC